MKVKDLKVRRDGHARRGWRRSEQADILTQLKDRRLETMERCRLAWEEDLDPVAICAAIAQSDLPAWLRNAVLVLVHDPELCRLPELWRRRESSMRDRSRVKAYLSALELRPDLTVEFAALLARERVQQIYPGEHEHNFGKEAMKSSVRRVRAGLKHPGRYHLAPRGMQQTVEQAWDAFIALIEARVSAKRKKVSKRPSQTP